MRTNAFVFDYEALKSSTEIELESHRTTIIDEVDDDESATDTQANTAKPPPSLFPEPKAEDELPF